VYGRWPSLEVPDIWTIDDKKFDNRIYVLVPSIEPLMIFFREGHLRFSVFNHSEPDTSPSPVEATAPSHNAAPPARSAPRKSVSRGVPRSHGGMGGHIVTRRLLWHRKRRGGRGPYRERGFTQGAADIGLSRLPPGATGAGVGGGRRVPGGEGEGGGRIAGEDGDSEGHKRQLMALSSHKSKKSLRQEQELEAAEAAAAALGVGGTAAEDNGDRAQRGGALGRQAGGKGDEEDEGEDAKKLPENDPKLARHVTNPRFGMAHTRDTNDVIKPVSYLRDALRREYDAQEAEARWLRYQNSIRNAAQMVLHAVRNRHWGHNKQWGYLFLAMDVASDVNQNAHVLDLNSGPSFYHHHDWPEWFVNERSAMIREAADIIQEVAFRKMVRQQRSPSTLSSSSLNDTSRPGKTLYRDSHDVMAEPLTNLGGWDEIYREDFSGKPLPQRDGLLKRDECPIKHQGMEIHAEGRKDASLQAQLAAVKQRLNVLINHYLRPGDASNDQVHTRVRARATYTHTHTHTHTQTHTHTHTHTYTHTHLRGVKTRRCGC